jgi:hypothetical protein
MIVARHADIVRVPFDPDVALNARYEAVPDRGSGLLVDIARQRGELVAAEPGQYIARPARRLEPLDNHLENAIPYGVAVQIVDALKVVEVEQEENVPVAVRPTSGRGLRERGQHGAPVRQARQRVLHGLWRSWYLQIDRSVRIAAPRAAGAR